MTRRGRGAAGCCFLLWAALAAPVPGRAEESVAARLAHALAAQEARESKSSPALLPILDELAQARRRDGDLAEAAALCRRGLGIALAAFGGESPRTAEALADLAQAHVDRRRYLDAEPLLIVAARVLAERAPDHPVRATVSAGLARIAIARGEIGGALDRAAQAVEIARRDPRHRSAEPLRALGAALAADQRFAEAERVLNEALAFDQQHHGGDAAETARSLSQLGNLYLRESRAGDALPLLQEAAAIDQMQLGSAHPFIADDLHDIGLVYAALNRPESARRAFLAAIGVLGRGAGRETPRVAYAEIELSGVYRRLGDVAAAEAALRDARRILDKAEAEERRRERRA